MNLQTLKEILKTFEQFRQDILSGEYDTQMILTGILSFLIETIKYEVDKKKEGGEIYK